MHKHLPARWDAKDAWYFVTVVTLKRHPYFASEVACESLLAACRTVRSRHPYRLGALAILPDHWHALIKPLEKEVIESVVGSIKQRVFHASRLGNVVSPTTTFSADKTHDAISALPGSAAFHGGEKRPIIRWQTRFMDHRIRNEADYFQHVEYMRLNPCKHELVKSESQPWRWWFMLEKPFG